MVNATEIKTILKLINNFSMRIQELESKNNLLEFNAGSTNEGEPPEDTPLYIYYDENDCAGGSWRWSTNKEEGKGNLYLSVSGNSLRADSSSSSTFYYLARQLYIKDSDGGKKKLSSPTINSPGGAGEDVFNTYFTIRSKTQDITRKRFDFTIVFLPNDKGTQYIRPASIPPNLIVSPTKPLQIFPQFAIITNNESSDKWTLIEQTTPDSTVSYLIYETDLEKNTKILKIKTGNSIISGSDNYEFRSVSTGQCKGDLNVVYGVHALIPLNSLFIDNNWEIKKNYHVQLQYKVETDENKINIEILIFDNESKKTYNLIHTESGELEVSPKES